MGFNFYKKSISRLILPTNSLNLFLKFNQSFLKFLFNFAVENQEEKFVLIATSLKKC
jgi:hypothetical protein